MRIDEVIDCALAETAPDPQFARLEKEKFGGLTARERKPRP